MDRVDAPEAAFLQQLGQVGHVPFGHRFLEKGVRRAIEADDDDALVFGLAKLA